MSSKPRSEDDDGINALEPEMRAEKIPTENIISVVDGAMCYVGVATAVIIGGQDVIVMARHIDQLRGVVAHINPARKYSERATHETVLVARRNATLDDEL